MPDSPNASNNLPIELHSSLPDPGSRIFGREIRFDDRLGLVNPRGITFEHCALLSWFLSKMPNPAHRTVFRNVVFDRCQFEAPQIGGAAFIDTTIRSSNGLQTHGAVFRHVRLSGAFQSLALGRRTQYRDPTLIRAWERANDRFNNTTNWALDISDATFHEAPDLSAVPGHLVGWQDTPSVFVEAHRLSKEVIDSINYESTPWRSALEAVLEEGRSEVLVAPVLNKNFSHYAAVMDALVAANSATFAPQTNTV